MLKGFYSVLVQSRPHASYSRPTSNGRKFSFRVRLCRTGRDAQESPNVQESPSSLRHHGIFRRVLLQELQRVAESTWHLQRLRLIVRQVNAVSTGMLHFSRAVDNIWFKHFSETRLRALQLSTACS